MAEGRVAVAAAGAAASGRRPSGRWVWEGGKLTKGPNGLTSCIPWTRQASNTDPTLFVWSAQSAVLLVAEPGLYQVSAERRLMLTSPKV